MGWGGCPQEGGSGCPQGIQGVRGSPRDQGVPMPVISPRRGSVPRVPPKAGGVSTQGMSPRPRGQGVCRGTTPGKGGTTPRKGGHPHGGSGEGEGETSPGGGGRAVTYGRGVALGALAGEAAEDAALRHLEAGGDGGDAGEGGGEAGDVRLHVAQQLLQLVQHWRRGGETGRERERKRGGGRPVSAGGPPHAYSQLTHRLLVGYLQITHRLITA